MNGRSMEGSKLAIGQSNLVKWILQLQGGQAVLDIHVADCTAHLLCAALLERIICLVIGNVVPLEHRVRKTAAIITLETKTRPWLRWLSTRLLNIKEEMRVVHVEENLLRK